MLASFFVAWHVALFLPVLAISVDADCSHVPHPKVGFLEFICRFTSFPLRICHLQENSLSVMTPLGIAHGVLDPSGVSRFTVRYGKAARWQHSSVVTAWDLPYVYVELLYLLIIV